ncbi:PIN domain-containing protein [bacterium]|nr:PIN domain-containing protein [bacterium]
MVNKIYLDTNAIMDAVLSRTDSHENCKQIMHSFYNHTLRGIVSTQTLVDLSYLLRKDYAVDEFRNLVIELCTILMITDVNREIILRAVRNYDINDFEDAVQYACALHAGADMLITSNVRDFRTCKIPVLTPAKAVAKFHL